MVRRFTRFAAVPLAFLIFLAFGGANGQPPGKSAGPVVGISADRAIEPEAKTVDELISKLEGLRKQKEEIEKQEKVVAEELKKRLKQQEERLAKLGLLPVPAKTDMVEPPLLIFPGSAPKVAK